MILIQKGLILAEVLEIKQRLIQKGFYNCRSETLQEGTRQLMVVFKSYEIEKKSV